MTIIRPHTSPSALNRIIALLIVAIMFVSVWLVVLYNQLVNFDHGISRANVELQRIQTEGAELKEKIFSLFDADRMQSLTAARGLTRDRAPRYFTE